MFLHIGLQINTRALKTQKIIYLNVVLINLDLILDERIKAYLIKICL